MLLSAVVATQSRARRATVVASSGFTLPTFTLDSGTTSFDVRPYVPGYDVSTTTLMADGTALPSNVTFNGTHFVRTGAGTASVSGVTVVIIPNV